MMTGKLRQVTAVSSFLPSCCAKKKKNDIVDFVQFVLLYTPLPFLLPTRDCVVLLAPLKMTDAKNDCFYRTGWRAKVL